MNKKPWLIYALTTTIFWGVWGAFIEIPEKAGFPATLGYIVWAITMMIPALVSLALINWKIETKPKAILYGLIVGFAGAAGQLLLFQALRTGPAYLVFPFVSLAPIVTIFLSVFLLKEKATKRAWIGIVVALAAIPLLSYQQTGIEQRYGTVWILPALLVFILWGVQAYFIKIANRHMQAENIFFYMMIAGIALVPIAFLMTDFSKPINMGLKGPWLAAAIQVLNAIGALFLVYAFRYGKAIIVSPLTNAGAPVITIVLSLIIYGVFPHTIILTGMILAIIAVFLLAD